MSLDEAMSVTNRLLTSADALAAMTARLRLAELGEDADPAVRAQLDRVADALGAREVFDGLGEQERSFALSFARSYLRQALDLVENPTAPPGWAYTDPVLLQAQGSASAAVAHLIESAGVGAPGHRILDVGTGVAGLAIELCSVFPDATVVGVDPWEPALEIARENIRAAGLDSRITLVSSTIEELEDAEGFDLAWLPTFFIPATALDAAISRIFALLREGGTLVLGTVQAFGDPLASAVDDMRTVRSGGSVLSADEGAARLQQAGFARVRTLDLGPDVPLRLVAGTRG